MPTRTNRYLREKDREFSRPDEVATYDEDKESLGRRVKRLGTGLAWAEEPPSRTRRLITNVQVRPGGADGEYEVVSYFLLYRNRLETETELFAGRRDDLLRRVEGGWRIARRTISLDQAVILAKNISLFF
jgi:3-phenylpropionate/cinnamic acid dioxygenase small subunit